jgi:hypothetical protein
MKYLFFAFFIISFSALSQPNHPVISQVYGGGGNTGAIFSNDFIEIFNPGAQSIDLSSFSLQYSSATGSTWNSLIPLSGIIPAKRYFLVQLAGGSNGISLPTPDMVATINLSASSGKIALVNSIVPLSGTCPLSVLITDFIGYGTANCSEGQLAGQGSSTVALIRKAGGCVDTENNSTDFITGTPAPRNTGSAMGDCSQMNFNLPIYFTNEKAVFENGKLELSWINNSEFEVESYQVEVSEQGELFKPVQEIHPKKNDGSSVQYAIRIHLAEGPFFRIRGAEFNGNTTYSKIIKVPPVFSSQVVLLQNPVINELTFRMLGQSKGYHFLSILNGMGQVIIQKLIYHSASTLFHLPVSHLNPGLYYLSVDGKIAGRFNKL